MKISKKIFTLSLLLLSLLAIPAIGVSETNSAEPSLAKIEANKVSLAGSNHSTEAASRKSLAGLENMGEEVPSFSDLFARVTKGLLYCLTIVLLFVGAYRKFFEKKQRTSSGALINVLDRKAIAPKAALLVVEVSGKQFLLSHVQDDVRLLSALNNQTQFDEDLVSAFEDSELTLLNQKSVNS